MVVSLILHRVGFGAKRSPQRTPPPTTPHTRVAITTSTDQCSSSGHTASTCAPYSACTGAPNNSTTIEVGMARSIQGGPALNATIGAVPSNNIAKRHYRTQKMNPALTYAYSLSPHNKPPHKKSAQCCAHKGRHLTTQTTSTVTRQLDVRALQHPRGGTHILPQHRVGFDAKRFTSPQ